MSHESRQPEFTDELLSAYLDGELTDEQRKSVDRQLATDEAARRLLDQLDAVSRSVRGLPAETLGEGFHNEVLTAAEQLEPVVPQVPLTDLAARTPSMTLGRTYRGWIYAAVAVAAAMMVAYIPMLQVNERDVAVAPDGEMAADAANSRPNLSDRGIAATNERRSVPRGETGGMGGRTGSMGAIAGRPAGSAPDDFEGGVEFGDARDANLYVVRVKLSPLAAKEMQVEQAILRNSIRFVAGIPAQQTPPMPTADDRQQAAAREPTAALRDDSIGQPHAPLEVTEQVQATDDVGSDRIPSLQARLATAPVQLFAIEAPLAQAGDLLRELSEDESGILTLEVESLDSGAAELSQWNRSAARLPMAMKVQGDDKGTPSNDREVEEPLAEVDSTPKPTIDAVDRGSGQVEPSAKLLGRSAPGNSAIDVDGERVDLRSRAGTDIQAIPAPSAVVEEKDEVDEDGVATENEDRPVPTGPPDGRFEAEDQPEAAPAAAQPRREDAVADRPRKSTSFAGKAIQLPVRPPWPEPLYAWLAAAPPEAATTPTEPESEEQRQLQQRQVVGWFYDAFGELPLATGPPPTPDVPSGTARILLWVEVAEEPPVAGEGAVPAAETGRAPDPAAGTLEESP